MKAAPAEAERTPPGRPARGHLGRCGGPPAARADDGGRRAPSAVGYGSPQPGLPARPNRRAVNPRAPPAAGSRTLRPSRPPRVTPESRGTVATVSPALGPRATLPPGLLGGSPSGLPERFTASLGTRCALLSRALSPRCRWAVGGSRSSCLPAAHLGVPGSSKHQGLSTPLPSACGHEYFRS